jgi:hypothetical protein
MWGNKKAEQPKPLMTWEPIDVNQDMARKVVRSPIPGGWLVVIYEDGTSMTFVPDPNHDWKIQQS